MSRSFQRCLLWLGAFLVASAAWAVEPGGHEGHQALWAGDRAWFEGDRGAAVAAWRRAAAAGDPAAEAMARLRLLHFTGNWGMAVHGPRVDRALQRCPDDDPWCWIARADFEIFAPAEVGAQPERAAELAARARAELPGPAAARCWLAAGEPALLRALQDHPRDGLGDGLLAADGRPPTSPGSWLLGLGLVGAPGLGIGGGLHFVHPDLGWQEHRLGLELGATSRGSAWLGVAAASSGSGYAHGSANLSRWVQDTYDETGASEWLVEGGRFAAGPGLRWGHHRLEPGVALRWDRIEGETAAGPGAQAAHAWDLRSGMGDQRRGSYLGTGVQLSMRDLGADYDHLLGSMDLRGYLGGPAGSVLAGRLLGERAFLPDAPWYRLPSAGGATVLRGAPAGRYRGDSLVALDLELRRMLWGPVEAVVFGAGAWVQDTGLHPAGGLGARLLLPPRGLNTVRLDLAVSDAGWAVTTGWGEVF